jgi:hypothetical protein
MSQSLAPPDRTAAADDVRLKAWRTAWPAALAAWSKYTRLSDPLLCLTQVEAARQGLSGSFAMIRLVDHSVVIDLEATQRLALNDYAVEILAHEIGHHVLAPANAVDQVRLLARIRRALPTLERSAPLVANLYTDLLINDRLQRQASMRMADVYRRLAETQKSEDRNSRSAVWMLYMGIYERLWKLPPGALGGATGEPGLATDAWLGARLIRAYAGDWLTAAGRFASLLLPYLVQDKDRDDQMLTALHDTRDAAAGCEPAGVQDVDPQEIDGNLHPSQDPLVTGGDAAVPASPSSLDGSSRGQTREPFEYGELLRAAGLKLDDHDVAVRYYRERALPHLVRFPTRRSPEAFEPQLEGLEPWELGDPLDELDGLQTVLQSPHVVAGQSTVRRLYGFAPSREPDPIPVDLDLYVDSSGSMPNPQQRISYLALAGAVIALSALRVGSAVQITLWSGKDEFMHTRGFVRDEDSILRVLTGFFGGGTTFPIHRLRDTYSGRPATARPVHILHLSDDGITTMFDTDERGNDGWQIAAGALAAARAGGTMALNIAADWERSTDFDISDFRAKLRRARDEQGWSIHPIARMEDLLEFARAFSRRNYSTQHEAAR